jgi:hypothetical protein
MTTTLNGKPSILGLRRTCTCCRRRRKVNAFWPDTGARLCTECSHAPDVAFKYSLRP